MKRGARENKRKRAALAQRQNRAVINQKREERLLAEPFPSIRSPQPDPRREFSSSSPLLDFYEVFSTAFALPGTGILIVNATDKVLNAEPGSFRELTQKINE